MTLHARHADLLSRVNPIPMILTPTLPCTLLKTCCRQRDDERGWSHARPFLRRATCASWVMLVAPEDKPF